MKHLFDYIPNLSFYYILPIIINTELKTQFDLFDILDDLEIIFSNIGIELNMNII